MPVRDSATKVLTAADVHVAGNSGTAALGLGRQGVGTVGIQANLLTLTGGTAPTVIFRLQWSSDNGATWAEADPAEPMTALSAVGNAAKSVQGKAALCRVAWTVTGAPATATADVYLWSA